MARRATRCWWGWSEPAPAAGAGAARAGQPKKTARKKPPAGPPAAAERPPAQFWRTTGFTRLAVPLSGVLGGKTAKAFESLKMRTVGDLMLHLPRRYVSGHRAERPAQPDRG